MGCMHTVQYHADKEEDELMPFPVTGKKLERITLSEVRYYCLWNLNVDTNKLLHKRETAS